MDSNRDFFKKIIDGIFDVTDETVNLAKNFNENNKNGVKDSALKIFDICFETVIEAMKEEKVQQKEKKVEQQEEKVEQKEEKVEQKEKKVEQQEEKVDQKIEQKEEKVEKKEMINN
jgi:TATA-binding protein-associated factor Taf7